MPETPVPRGCGTKPELLSALVDGALVDAERERLLTHVGACASCRAEAEELRRVRDLLGASGLRRPPEASSQLSRRLVDIAGSDASTPLWTRPFDPTRDGPTTLPLRHRVLRQRVGTASLVAVFLLVALTTVGWTAAPEATAPVTDPGPRGQAAFGAALGQVPLGTEAMTALVLSGTGSGEELLTGQPIRSAVGSLGRDQPITADEALVVLQNSTIAGAMLARSGTQEVRVRVADGVVAARVEVRVQPGQSTQVEVSSMSGKPVNSGSLAAPDSSAAVDLLAAAHTLSGYLHAGEVAGRASTVVEARDGDQLEKRWWIDAESGLLLRTERFDESGVVDAVSGFSSVQIGQDVFSAQMAPRLATFSGAGTMSLSEAPKLSAQGWSCAEELAGLPLIQLRTASSGQLHTAYSDGVRTVGVVQQHGTLEQRPVGFEWDESLAAWRSTSSLPAQLIWQSGDRVITVTTDSPDGTVWEAVADLPHDEPEYRTPLDRVLEGWQRIGSLVLQS